MGPCAGGACYSPALTDFIFMVKDTSYMFITGPAVVKTLPTRMSPPSSWVAPLPTPPAAAWPTVASEDEMDCLQSIRTLLSFLPSNNLDDAPLQPALDPARPRGSGTRFD
jgi:propionyl-CoA carboxylase beta chain